jgi:hypothetical protein
MIDTQLYEPCEHARALAAQLRAWTAGERELPDLMRLTWPCRHRARLECLNEVFVARSQIAAANAAHDLVVRLGDGVASDLSDLSVPLADLARRHLPYPLLAEALARHASSR